MDTTPVSKRCTKCGKRKRFDLFHRNKEKRDGRYSHCIDCCKARDSGAARRASRAWVHINNRAGNADGNNPTYTAVKILISKADFLAWAVPAFATWIAANPGIKSSIDRINPKKHYAAGNLRVIALTENIRIRPYNKNVHAQACMAWCSRCQEYKPVVEFYKSKQTAHGLHNNCKKCHNAIVAATS